MEKRCRRMYRIFFPSCIIKSIYSCKKAASFAASVVTMILLLSSIVIASPSKTPTTAAMAQQTDANQIQKQQKIDVQKEYHPPDLKIINSGPPPSSDNFVLPPGYTIEPVLWNLTLPGSIAFDDKGNMYIAEIGYSYGQYFDNPRILKMDASGNNNLSVVVNRFLFAPLTDIAFNNDNGLLYAQHRAQVATVNVSNGLVNDLVVGLPTDEALTHPQGQMAFGPDGRVYFSTGTFTNTGIVDKANYNIGWLKTDPGKHDIPAINITLTGQNFESENWLTPANKTDKAVTGAYVPFGTPAQKGQVIEGDPRCTGCLFSINADGTDERTHVWGLRSPFGMVFDDEGRLFIANNGADDKGIRPITGDLDTLYIYDLNNATERDSNNLVWYGWPEYYGMGVPITDPRFAQSSHLKQPLDFLFEEKPPLTKPFASLGYAVGQTQAAFSNNTEFGMQDKILVAEFGTISPITHSIGFRGEESMVGQKVVAVDAKTGAVTNFIDIKNPDPSFRPVGLEFNPEGDTLYIISYGETEIRTVLPDGTELPKGTLTPHVWPHPNAGVVWKVTKVQGQGNNNDTTTATAATTATASASSDTSTASTTSAATASTIHASSTTPAANIPYIKSANNDLSGITAGAITTAEEESNVVSSSNAKTATFSKVTSLSLPSPSSSSSSPNAISAQVLTPISFHGTSNDISNQESSNSPNGNTNTSNINNTSTATTINSKNSTIIAISKGADNFVNNRTYVPQAVNISVGTTVKWANGDITPHTATAKKIIEGIPGTFDSKLIKPGGIFEHTFNSPGTVEYACMIHPWMVGRISVQSNGTTAALLQQQEQSLLNTTAKDATNQTNMVADKNMTKTEPALKDKEQGKVADDTVAMAMGASNADNAQFFVPETTDVKVGDTVRWINDDFAAHTATAGTPEKGPTGKFDSNIMNTKSTFTHTFNEAGTFDYYCTLHPWMTGRVIVR